MNLRNNTLMMTASALLAPALFVFGSRFIGGGPASARADTSTQLDLQRELPNFEPAIAPAPRDTNRPVKFPFYIEPYTDHVLLPNPNPLQNRPALPNQPKALPPVSITSILPSSKNPLAVIDGRPRRVGDTLESGWTVISINAEDNTISLQHSSGAKIRAGLKNGS